MHLTWGKALAPFIPVALKLHWLSKRKSSLHDAIIFFARATAEKLAQPAALPQAVRLWLATYLRALEISDDELRQIARTITKAHIRDVFFRDPYFCNTLLNFWECEQSESRLDSSPIDISVPVSDVCNARCSFCTSWLEGKRFLEIAELDRLAEPLKYTRTFGLAGHGEPLAHPKLPDVLNRIRQLVDPRAKGYVITNGAYLSRHLDNLLRANIVSYAISLNAACASTHNTVMGMGEKAFGEVVDALRQLLRRRDSNPGIYVSVSMVLLNDNIAEAAEFIRMANALKVDNIQIKTLAAAGGKIPGLNYHLLPPYRHPDFSYHCARLLDAIKESKVSVTTDPHSWSTPILPADIAAQMETSEAVVVDRQAAINDRAVREHYRNQRKYLQVTCGEKIEECSPSESLDPFGRQAPYRCAAPYRNLYVNDFSFNVSPCCYMPQTPGHSPVILSDAVAFPQAWNSAAMVTLRQRLRDGPLFEACAKCPSAY